MSNRQPAPAVSESQDDTFTLAMITYSSLGAILTVAGGIALKTWTQAVSWMIQHQVLVPAIEHPAVALPFSRGAGLDTPRLVLLLAVVLTLLAALVDAGHRLRARRRRQEQAA